MDTNSDTQTAQSATADAEDMLRLDSPFLNPGPVARADSLAIIQLSKDDLVPVYLKDTQGEHDGYKEGHVLNTRFGSFPHSTLIGVPWGSQVRASNVDTGSRGRKRKRGPADEGEKRDKNTPSEDATLVKGEETQDDAPEPSPKKKGKQAATTAKSGFVHILRPTPEVWTSSLPHRTQVVYTPDYSYILQRIRARPGSRLIEAGAGSGSFTHASARAVYNGQSWRDTERHGKVYSYEFHEQRFKKMQKEIRDHGLDHIVDMTHRDVYEDGFLVDGKSPEADAIFLDLPAPWLALPHLSRRKPRSAQEMEGVQTVNGAAEDKWVSPLNPKKSVYLCTFSPCIEQVTKTVAEMRKLGWVEIDMVEISHKKIQVFREKIGLGVTSERGVQLAPRDVAEALFKLKEIEVKAAEHNAKLWAGKTHPDHKNRKADAMDVDDDADEDDEAPLPPKTNVDKGAAAPEEAADTKTPPVKPFMQGQLVTRTETEIKTHTSYLVFAILPREWTEEDEAAALAKWPCGGEKKVIGAMDRDSRKQERREILKGKGTKKKEKKAAATAEEQPAVAGTTETAES